jgi:type IV pilus assembly protein PilE
MDRLSLRPQRTVPAGHPEQRGFTLVEVMVTVAIVAILASIAMPAYTAYIQRSRVPAGLDALQSYFTRMEQRFQDSGNYANAAACAVAVPVVQNYVISCVVVPGGATYVARATGTGTLSGYVYTIDSNGTRTTAGHPKGLPPGNCWSIKGVSCDA